METDEITDLPPMISARSSPSAELLNDSVYVFGGTDRYSGSIGTVERYGWIQNSEFCWFDSIFIHFILHPTFDSGTTSQTINGPGSHR